VSKPPRTPNNPREQKARAHRINEDIDVAEVRLVGEEDESLNGLQRTSDMLAIALQRGVDLVEITKNVNPPVCRLIEYSKFLYELKKKEKDSKAKQHIVLLKEIRFGPNTDEHDFNFKLRHAENFIEEGHKIKAYVVFHGRSIVHKERGEELLRNFAEALHDIAKVEMPPRLEGKRMFLILAPKKT
jgi:translation initiation factor IF-3